MPETALIYTRPWNARYLTDLARIVFEGMKRVPTTDFVGYEGDRLGRLFTENLRQGISGPPEPYDEDVTRRCRVLRELQPVQSRRLIAAMRSAVREVLEREAPDVILGTTVDSYVLDLVRYEAAAIGVPYLGLIPSTINGYSRVTGRGEHLRFREVSNDETSKAVEALQATDYRPAYTPSHVSTRGEQIVRPLRKRLRVPYYGLMARVRRDRWSYNYLARQTVSRRTSKIGIIPRSTFDQDWHWRARILGRPILYMPLQVWPEANSEYWCRYEDFLPYQEGVLTLVERCSSAATFLVKEHPQMLGYRERDFYSALDEHDHVVLVPPHEPSFQILDAADAAVAWSGSIGMEAALRGRPILDLGGIYLNAHSAAYSVESIQHLDDCVNVIDSVARMDPLSSDQVHEYVRRLLSGLVPGRVRLGRINRRRSQHARASEIVELGEQIQDYFPSWFQAARAAISAGSLDHVV